MLLLFLFVLISVVPYFLFFFLCSFFLVVSVEKWFYCIKARRPLIGTVQRFIPILFWAPLLVLFVRFSKPIPMPSRKQESVYWVERNRLVRQDKEIILYIYLQTYKYVCLRDVLHVFRVTGNERQNRSTLKQTYIHTVYKSNWLFMLQRRRSKREK